jgi:integrase
MRNPNGYGCVYKASGNRRKPYIARITIGWNDDGKQIFKMIGSFATSKEAQKALADYNSNPYDIDAAKVTFSELYAQWSKEKYPKISNSMMLSYKNAYRACKLLHDMQFGLIRKHHIQMTINESDKTYSGKARMKMLISQMSQFAMENDIISKDYSSYVDVGEKPDRTLVRLPFTEDQIKKLYQSLHIYRFTDTILMMIFSGVRPSELLLTETENVHLDENYFVCGIKNNSSKNRKVPISRFVRPFFEKYYNEAVALNSKWLIVNTEGQRMKYSNYNRDKFHKIMERLEMEHMPHDCRHSFASFMDKIEANKLCTQLIMGHSPRVLIDNTYVHKTVKELQAEIDKLETLFNLDEMLSLINPKYWANEYQYLTFAPPPEIAHI